ncbi:MAG TPA: hypothetical protein VF937_01850 [Chloroflexota bacterium]
MPGTVPTDVRVLALIASGLLVEAGWLALWPLSSTLSHSALFTTAILTSHPLVRRPLDLMLAVAGPVVPGLSTTPLAAPLGSPDYAGPAFALAGVMLWLAAAYALALVVLGRGLGGRRSAVWLVVAGAVVFQATLFWLPGLFSQDVFSYIAYGRLAAQYNLNPYIWPPSVLNDPAVGWVADVWRTYASPYGPLWVDVQWLLARLTGGLSIGDQALVYRLLGNLLLLANLGLVWRLLGRLTRLTRAQRTTALAALAWNPLVLFEISGNAHNDALMVSFSFIGLLLFGRSSRGVLTGAAFTLGALVKYLSGAGLIWVAVASAARAATWARAGRRLFLIALVACPITLALAAPWLELPDSLDPLLNETAGVGYVNSLPDRLILLLADHSAVPLDLARGVARMLVLGGFAVYVAWEVRQVWSRPRAARVARALARSSLVYVLVVSTSMQPWYLCLPLAIALSLGVRHGLARVALGYGMLALPALYVSYYLRDLTPGWIFLAYGCVPLIALLPGLTARARTGPHIPATEAIGHHEQRPGRHRVARAVMEEAGR